MISFGDYDHIWKDNPTAAMVAWLLLKPKLSKKTAE